MSRTGSITRVRTPDMAQDELKQAHGTQIPSWRKLSLLEAYSGIPAGTLCSIAKTGKVPNKWRERFGLPALAPAPVCPVHGVVHLARRCPVLRKPRQAWMTAEEVEERLEYIRRIYE